MNWVLIIVVLTTSNPIQSASPPTITMQRFITESACNEASSHVVKNTNPKNVFVRCIKDA